MHSWYAELPKDLASLNSFFVRESMYWKDLAQTNDLETYYLYNAKDTHATALVLLAWIKEAPQWAKNNYLMEFPVQYPCIQAELTGIKRDNAALQQQRTISLARIESKYHELRKSISSPNFNSNSPVQVKNLLKVLGCEDLPSTDENNLKKAIFRHPLNARILSLILDIRGDRKLVSTYLRTDEDITKTSPKGAKELNGRILYALNPHGTDTGRLASREHHFWCGLQIQNIPRGKEVKCTIVSDTGFLFGESDLEQAESRDTAYITGDKNLIIAVSSGRDFHATNASSFFGVAYEKIYDDATKKTLDKKLRDLAKRVNHGANYNMGWMVLIDTMGLDKITEAQRLLNLPKGWTYREVAEYLLARFGSTYPGVRDDYPIWIKRTIAMTHMLVGATGWTRYCFSDPTKSKPALNAYIAHNPQSLNAMILNKAWLSVFQKVALPNPYDFKLCAQIHDSILFQYRIGHEHLAHQVKELMEIPVNIKDIKGKEHTFTVPAALKLGKTHWSELD
jgi:DNA polymerase I-like protein with 3'-5' exonuclease and polymerase domains